MSDDIDAMMAVGLLHTVRDCAHRLYGENQTYPCDDVKRMAAENERLRTTLEKMQRSRDRYRQAWEAEKVRARAALEGKHD